MHNSGNTLAKMHSVPKTKLVTINAGNVHEAAAYADKFGLSDFVLTIAPISGGSIIVFRLPHSWPCDNLGPVPASTRVNNQEI